jgi:hypothetical protein
VTRLGSTTSPAVAHRLRDRLHGRHPHHEQHTGPTVDELGTLPPALQDPDHAHVHPPRTTDGLRDDRPSPGRIVPTHGRP